MGCDPKIFVQWLCKCIRGWKSNEGNGEKALAKNKQSKAVSKQTNQPAISLVQNHLPLIAVTPKKAFFQKNKLALINKNFIEEEIMELVNTGRVKEARCQMLRIL